MAEVQAKDLKIGEAPDKWILRLVKGVGQAGFVVLSDREVQPKTAESSQQKREFNFIAQRSQGALHTLEWLVVSGRGQNGGKGMIEEGALHSCSA
ncbi:hypothetical protein H4Q26_006555 [Puccinia striiformis f. sp. tritici PST-130]|nr:hypothetical protein H4Q26_006555 [Puccinia striiformis f. sp. tritici PST-130]